MKVPRENYIEMHNVTTMEFGLLNNFIEENFDHVDVEYHYNRSIETGIVRLYSESPYVQEFMEAVRILFVIMETEDC